MIKIAGRPFEIDGQIYRKIGHIPHTCQNGQEVELAVYVTRCATCGAAFNCLGPKQRRGQSLNRRCPEHRSPGRRVRSERRYQEHVAARETRRAVAASAIMADPYAGLFD